MNNSTNVASDNQLYRRVLSAMVSLIESRIGKFLKLKFELSIMIRFYLDHAVIDSQMLFVDSMGSINRYISPGYAT